MTRLIETDNRVFELTITPGDEVPGNVKRTANLTQLSGEPLSNDEWLTLKNRCVAELVSQGLDLIGWEAT